MSGNDPSGGSGGGSSNIRNRNAPELPKDPDFKFSKGTFTALRLYHSSEKDIDRETRVLFIGPIPQYWLKRNKKTWVRKLVKSAFFDKTKLRSSAQTALIHGGTLSKRACTDVDEINEEAFNTLGALDTNSLRETESILSSIDFNNQMSDSEVYGSSAITEEDLLEEPEQLMNLEVPLIAYDSADATTAVNQQRDLARSSDVMSNLIATDNDMESLGGDTTIGITGTGIMRPPAGSPHRSNSLLLKGSNAGISMASDANMLKSNNESIAESQNTESMSDSSFFTAREQGKTNQSIRGKQSLASFSQDSAYRTAHDVSIDNSDDDASIGNSIKTTGRAHADMHGLLNSSLMDFDSDDDSGSLSGAESTESIVTMKPYMANKHVDMTFSSTAHSDSPITVRDYLSDVLERNNIKNDSKSKSKLRSKSNARQLKSNGDVKSGKSVSKVPSTIPYYNKPAPRTKPETKRTAVRFVSETVERGKNGSTSLLKTATHRPARIAQKLHTVKDRATVISTKKFLRSKKKGEIVMIEKMLVMIKRADNDFLPANFNEMETCDTRIVDRWREYIVVARNTGNVEAPILIQFYSKRQVERIQADKSPKSKYDIVLGKDYGVNLYSSLDKTLSLWCRIHGKGGSYIYLFRTKSQETAMQWLAFFSGIIGLRQGTVFKVGIPDIGINVDIDLPFNQLQALLAEAANDDYLVTYDDVVKFNSAPNKLLNYIVDQCIEVLSKTKPTRDSVVKLWQSKELKIGLAWRRYDRIEWIFDNHDIHIQTGWAMMRTHDLELRPKLAYSRPVIVPPSLEQDVPLNEKHLFDEPPAVEGFLTRTSTWFGKKRKKIFSPRMYWYTSDGLLFYCNPMKSFPPHPSIADTRLSFGLDDDESFKNLNQKNANIPLYYEAAPFQLNSDGHIAFLAAQNLENFLIHDKAASNEANRRVSAISHSIGVIDLTTVDVIRPCSGISNDQTSADDDSFESNFPNLEFELLFNRRDKTRFLRLRAANKTCRDLWVSRLNQLVIYWKLRKEQDLERRLRYRQKNLDLLNIDEDTEAFIGEMSSKWEVDRALADPFLYNINMYTWSRPILIHGELFQKASKHSSFKKYFVVLTQTDLILYENSRKYTTRSEIDTLDESSQYRVSSAALNYEKVNILSLVDCYVYSGPITSLDLLNRTKWFDKEHPGHHALPRAYSDKWRSSEEEALTCFVLWFGKKRPIKEKLGDNTIKFSNRLGVRGTSMVFMTRSRQDRERWVTALSIVTNRAEEEAKNADITIH